MVVVDSPSYATTLLTNRIKIYLLGSDKKKPKISAALLPFIQLLRSRIICRDACWCFVKTQISDGHKSLFLNLCQLSDKSNTSEPWPFWERADLRLNHSGERLCPHLSPEPETQLLRLHTGSLAGQRFGNRYRLRRSLSDSFCEQCLRWCLSFL